MRYGTMALAAALLLLGGTATARHAPQTAPAAPATADVIAGRQAAFRLSGALFGSIRGAADSGADVKSQAFAARALAGWAKALPGMFPQGSGTGATEALPVIWTDWAGFNARAADYAAAAAKLADLAKAGDQPGFAAQVKVVGAACGACHETYRKPDSH